MCNCAFIALGICSTNYLVYMYYVLYELQYKLLGIHVLCTIRVAVQTTWYTCTMYYTMCSINTWYTCTMYYTMCSTNYLVYMYYVLYDVQYKLLGIHVLCTIRVAVQTTWYTCTMYYTMCSINYLVYMYYVLYELQYKLLGIHVLCTIRCAV